MAARLHGAGRDWLTLGWALALVAVTACSGDDGSGDATEPAPTTTTTRAVTTTQPPAAVEDIVAVFDGTTCTYEGPDQATPASVLSIRFTNKSDEPAELFITTSEGADLEESLSLIGTDVGPDQTGGIDAIAIELASDPGESATGNVLLAPGTWIVDCHTTGGGHFWFIAAIESG